MNLTLITHAIAALTAAGAVWVFQDARWAADVADIRLSQADEQSAAVSRARAEERAINKTYQEALNAARTRETSLRRDIDAARTESDSLREQLSYAARLIADAPPPPPSLSTPLPSVSYSLSAAESERSSQKKLMGTHLMSEPSSRPGL